MMLKTPSTLAFFSLLLFMLSACQEPPKTAKMLQINSGEAVNPGYALSFPKDHGAHSEQGIEWWYLTANLTSKTGKTFGAQWTLFRTSLPQNVNSQWFDDQVYFAHFALQDDNHHVAFERFARKGQASIHAAPFNAHLDDWQLKSQGAAFLPLQLNAKEGDYALNISLKNSPLVLHGDNGYSQKTQSGHASYYYSYPFLEASGQLVFKGETYQVTGKAWYDREWSASLLDQNHFGWDWFSISSDNNNALMVFCIRNEKSYDHCAGSKINAQGHVTSISKEQIALKATEYITLDNKQYPSQWRLTLDNRDEIMIETINKDSRNQLSIEYWEGRIKATGALNGLGYAELTGY